MLASCFALSLALAVFAPDRAAAQTPPRSALSPDGGFVQAGGGSSTETLTLGLLWRLTPTGHFAGGTLTGYVEASIGFWSPPDDTSSRWVTQVGLTPVLRWRGDGPWFGELGIGANIIAPIFSSADRRFSTNFNFGDHLAFGRHFGARDQHEVALRVEHFSNGGIRKPNPGINFVQLRFASWF